MRKSIALIITLILYLHAPLCAQKPTYDFMQTLPDGQVLFFKITDENSAHVAVVSQYNRTPRYDQVPKGMIDIPATAEFEGHRYVVTEIGEKAFMGCKELSVVKLPSNLRFIGAYAFSGCQRLVSATLPQNLEEIGSSAFSNCQELAGPLTIPSKVTRIGSFAFSGCQSLTSLQLSDQITEIGSSAFKGCNGIRGSITITPSVTAIGNSAFAECTRLASVIFYGSDNLTMGSSSAPVFAGCIGITSVTIGDNVRVIPDNAFKGCSSLREMSLPQRLTAIGHSAFYQCSNLEGDLVIPNTVTTIGGSAFYGCSSLSSLRLSSQMTSVSNFAFYQCSGMEGKLVLPESITSIGNSAFKGCSSLTGALDLPAGMTYIGNEAFMGCDRLTGTLTIPIGMTSIGNSAFADCRRISSIEYGAEDCKSMGAVGHAAFHGCSGIRSVTIFNGVKQIPANAFSNCTNLSGTLKIPAGVAVIGSNAFSGCTQITAIELPDDITTIGSGAFRGCTRLDGQLVIPGSVSTIGNNAFENCISIASLQLEGFPPHIGNNTFQGISNILPVYVPCKSLNAYQNNENWRYFTRIEGNSSENRLQVRSSNDTLGTVRIIQNNTCSFAQAIVQAIPAAGYMFVGWNDGSRDNPRTLVVDHDTTLIARFDTSYLVTISVTSSNGALGTALVLGGSEFEPGDKATIVAAPQAGATFLGWSDGNKENPREVTVNNNVRYTALFVNPQTDGQQTETGAETLDQTFPMKVEGNTITIEHTKGHSVTVYDDYGRQVEHRDDCPATFRYRTKTPGNYLVRIDNGETRRVVIAD